MDLGIKGKIALVTGGSRGLGRYSALALAREGVQVAICARTEETLNKTIDELQAYGVSALSVVADITEAGGPSRVHQAVLDGLGEVDILVNNVGGSRSRAGLLDTSLDDFKGTFDLNLFAAFELCKLTLPPMKQKHWGRIINIASIWGREYGGNISYMSAKAALIAAGKHLALEVAQDGISVNSIAPGSILFSGGSWDRFQKEQPPEVVQQFIDQNLPTGKFGTPEPVGDLVAFLASENASLITGACINIDGGQSRSLI
jgi:3-oxoacyl-[acyl-carrier protein] reductase